MAREAKVAEDGKKSVNLRLTPEVYGAIEKLATEDERTMSAFIERHLRKAFQPATQVSGITTPDYVPGVIRVSS